MTIRECRTVDPNCKAVSFEDQMVEAVKIITNRLMKFKPQRGYRRKAESFGIRCNYDGKSDTIQVIGSIVHEQRGLYPEERIEAMAEAMMDWDKASGRR